MLLSRDELRRRRLAAVEALLADPVWLTRSTNWLAQVAGVPWVVADQVRTRLGKDGPVRRQTQSGRQHPRSFDRRVAL